MDGRIAGALRSGRASIHHLQARAAALVQPGSGHYLPNPRLEIKPQHNIFMHIYIYIFGLVRGKQRDPKKAKKKRGAPGKNPNLLGRPVV